MSGALREALERLVTAAHRVQPDPLSVRTMAEIPRDRLIALWDAEHAARAALAAAQPAEGLDVERLARALWINGIGHLDPHFEEIVPGIAAEYARLRERGEG